MTVTTHDAAERVLVRARDGREGQLIYVQLHRGRAKVRVGGRYEWIAIANLEAVA